MIIQCRVCQTKYRFDEAMLGVEGAWVRCVRCRNVFFQHPPLSMGRDLTDRGPAGSGEKGETGTVPAVEEKREVLPVGAGNEAPPLADVGIDARDEVHASDAPVREGAPRAGDPDREEDAPLRERLTIPAGLSKSPQEEDGEEAPAPPRGRKKNALVWALGLIMLILAAAGGALFVFPEYGQIVMTELNVLFPGLGLRAAPEAPAAVGPAQVRIADVRQRFVANPLLGNVRVVEGLAVNTSPYPMTRIKIRGELHDLVGALVKDSASFCGNLLGDEDLAIMSEEQIFRELSIPQGSDVPNDRIEPQGTIPFMLIFVREPAGVDKTIVMPVAAERLLSP